jgi:Family of unknown function (DUF5677)
MSKEKETNKLIIGDVISQREFESRHSTFLSKVEEIQNLIFFCAQQLDNIDFKTIDDKVIYTFFRQNVESFNSIFILTGNGFSRNSMILLRSMYEHCVTMKYLKFVIDNPIKPNEKKPFPDNVGKFLDFYYVNRNKYFKKLFELFPKDFTEEDKKKFEVEFNTIKAKFVTACQTCKTPRPDHKWSNNDIISMAKKVKLDESLTFDCYYRALTLAHPSANSINERWLINSDGSISYQFESEEDERKTLLYAHSMLLISIETLFSHFQIIDADDLLKNNWNLCNEVWFETK